VIAHLRGEVIAWEEQRLVVDVNGVGYEVFSPLSSTGGCRLNDKVALHVHTVVREDALALYGFLTPAERDMFLLLTSVSGVGPKVALAVLSGLSLGDLTGAIAREDVALLSKCQGVGKKTASRIALELQDKVGALGIAHGAHALVSRAGAAPRGHLSDAVSALVNLGYSKARAEAAVRAIASDADQPVEELIRKGLVVLSQ